MEVVTKVPVSNRPALRRAPQMGFQRRFERAEAWVETDGRLGPLVYFGFTLDTWIETDERAPLEGAAFHATLERAKRAAGSALAPHDDDPAHDRAVGAAVQMMRAGNVRKAVWTYNRWARLAGYQLITLLSETPVAIEFDDVVVEVGGQAMEILRCQQR
jgi:hypothetical protein